MKTALARDTYFEIREKIHGVHYYWYTLKQLYDDTRTIRIINASGDVNFFRFARNAYLQYVVLNISKLLDPARDSRGNINLSFGKLLEELKNDRYIIDGLDDMLKTLVEESKPLRNYRRKIVAHSDYDAYKHQEKFTINKKCIQRALSGMRKFINTVGRILKTGKYDIKPALIDARNDLRHVTRCMQKALIFDELEKNGKISGKITGEYRSLYKKSPASLFHRLKNS
jgi:hypothetical protein